MAEGHLQKYFKRQATKHKVFWRKIAFEGQRGCPDILLLNNGRAMFVELKHPDGTGKLSELQKYQIAEMRAAGAVVHVINSKDEVDEIIKEIKN
jgi:hypothetical protein